MEIDIIPIGNSRGIRLPKAILEQCGFESAVDVSVDKDRLILRPVVRARKGWEAAFKAMGQKLDDKLVETPGPEFDESDWQW